MKKLLIAFLFVLTSCTTHNPVVEVPEVDEELPSLVGDSPIDFMTLEDFKCLSDNVYHEARGETLEGQRAVARVTINRYLSDIRPFNKYKNICDVVYDGGYGKEGSKTCQFAWTCDTIPDEVPESYMQHVQKNVLLHSVTMKDFECVLYYHADDGRIRGWIQRGGLINPTKIDGHLFYKDPSCI